MNKHSEPIKKEPKQTMKDFFQSQKAHLQEQKQIQFPSSIDDVGDLNISDLALPILSNTGSNKQPQVPTLGVLYDDFGAQTIEEVQFIITQYDFVSLIFKNEYIPCSCSTQKCNICQNTKLINIQQMKNQLNEHFRDYFHKNYQALVQFLQDKYDITIETFNQWVDIHKQMQFPSENQKFIFQCSSCHKYLKDQNILFRSQDKDCCSNCKNTLSNSQFQQFNYRDQSIIKAETPLFGESQNYFKEKK